MHDTMVRGSGSGVHGTALRIFLLSATLLVLLAGVSLATTWIVGERSARSAADSALDSGITAQRALSRQRLDALQRTAERIARASGAEIEAPETVDPDAGAAAPLATATLLELLLRQQATAGFDLGLVLDSDAVLLADSSGGTLGASLATDPLVAPALAAATPMNGFWAREGQLYLAAAVPLTQGASVTGLLVLARRVDDALARAIAGIGKAQVAFWLPRADGPALVASSLDSTHAQSLAQRFGAAPALVDALQLGQPLERMQLELDGEPWLLRLAPAGADPGVASGAVMALTPASAAAGGYRQILGAVLAGAAIALLLALPWSWWLSRRLLRPVQQLAEVAARAAGGDYQADATVSGDAAMQRLGAALAALLADLRERAALEEYLSAASRVPTGAGDSAGDDREEPAPATAAEAPRQTESVLLGMELPPAGDAADAIAGASGTTARLQALAREHHGELVCGDGERWTLAFDGPQRLQHALDAARAALSGFGSGALRPALALAEGLVERATVQVGERPHPLLLGTAGRQLVRLLCESAPARALIARPLGDRIREHFGTEALEVAAGALGGRRYYALRTSGLPATVVPPVGHGDAPLQASPAIPAARHGLQRGTRIDDRYEILATLGDGGMGTVYKAHDGESAETVALRVLRPEADRPAGRLQEEVRLLRRIVHPNVVPTFEAGSVDGHGYVTTEFVHGMRLRELLEHSGRLPYPAALRVARQLCEGLAAGHAIGALHRDVRPANVVLSGSGNARWMDFGIAPPLRRSGRTAEEESADTLFVGVPDYCAPEQLAGDAVDERADVYACGVLLSELFCGGLPHAGDSASAIYLAQLRQEPLRPSQLWPEVPAALERIILRCIARRREDRFQDARALAEALSGIRS